ncbi:hypothetical protein Mapa_003549 [Marchantia paleacea]|nr:hypothetical protein Mapa_003549 [Marchantia paleacea]
MKTHSNEFLSALQKLPSERYHQIYPISNLLLLGPGCQDEQLGSWMLHFQLIHHSPGVSGHKQLLEMIYHHLIHSVRSQRSAGHLR